MQRSFFDSNGDNIGDLNGLRMKLDYLQELGVTSILMLPLYESVYYHNYFASSFENIDPEFGTIQDYLALVREVHRRGMKIYMDMEMQYVTEDHPWYKESFGHPHSVYAHYIVYKDAANRVPETMVFNLSELKSYDGTVKKIGVVNLNNDSVKAYTFRMFRYWMDPDRNGNFEDGVDGFRLDHMMDNLDGKGVLTNLFAGFWTPMITRLREINPKIKFIAEQADWGSYGTDYIKKAGVDRVFAFRLRFAFTSFDKAKITAETDSLYTYFQGDHLPVVFIENHDLPRFGSVVHHSILRLKTGAALNLLTGGVPSIYYGQELGMYGAGGFAKYGMTDANDIPQREAFEWNKADIGPGMAFWYKNSGPWWDSTNVKPNDGISLEEENSDPNSLLNFYKFLISLRNDHPALADGQYEAMHNNNGKVYSFIRYNRERCTLVALNLSDSNQTAVIDCSSGRLKPKKLMPLYSNSKTLPEKDKFTVEMEPFAIDIWEEPN